MKTLIYLLLFTSICTNAMLRECSSSDIPEEYHQQQTQPEIPHHDQPKMTWWRIIGHAILAGFERWGQVQHPDMYTADLSTAQQDRVMQPRTPTTNALRRKQ